MPLGADKLYPYFEFRNSAVQYASLLECGSKPNTIRDVEKLLTYGGLPEWQGELHKGLRKT